MDRRSVSVTTPANQLATVDSGHGSSVLVTKTLHGTRIGPPPAADPWVLTAWDAPRPRARDRWGTGVLLCGPCALLRAVALLRGLVALRLGGLWLLRCLGLLVHQRESSVLCVVIDLHDAPLNVDSRALIRHAAGTRSTPDQYVSGPSRTGSDTTACPVDSRVARSSSSQWRRSARPSP